ncbi:MAG: hypothetical protein OXB92_09020 [Acidimicrobiaceae bacterium]|nr:hypothetical protein [Acidimicrobiaceae bacterium]
MLLGTRNRLGEMHTWPELRNFPFAQSRLARAGSTSSSTMTGA